MEDFTDWLINREESIKGVREIKMEEFVKFLEQYNYWNKIEIKDNEITVGGSLYLRETEIKELPNNLTVGGYLDLSETEIKELPDNLTVGGYLDLRGTEIKELPDNLTVGGSLDLRGTEIKELPDNLTVGGYLDLRGTEIKELPDNLTVGGSLYLRGTEIKELPDNLTVGEYLDLSETEIKELPDNLTVGGYLDLSGTEIKELPDNLTVGGSLYLRGTEIKELPDNLTVGGYLDLRGTEIKELPDNLTVGGSLDLRGTEIKDTGIQKVKELRRGYNKERNYIYFDGILWGNVKSIKKVDDITIYKIPLGYCTVEKDLSAHGKTLRQAMEDLTFKKLRNTDNSEIVKEIKETRKVTRVQYRAITGACQFGTNKFCEEHKIQDLEEIELDKLKEILIPGKDYGAEEFWNLINEE